MNNTSATGEPADIVEDLLDDLRQELIDFCVNGPTTLRETGQVAVQPFPMA
ncbi:MAG: hypothetical protein HC905_20040 [Bacteroidales bacterium]|nr:hypothetical protein [Bacteroidales bacterium]